MTAPRWVLLGDAAPDVAAALHAAHGPLAVTGVAHMHGLAPPADYASASEAPRYVLLANATRDPAPSEHAWRVWLLAHGMAFEALYPHPQGDWLTPLRQRLGLAPRPERPVYAAWACERCADPACEHRLFTDLMARRASAPG